MHRVRAFAFLVAATGGLGTPARAGEAGRPPAADEVRLRFAAGTPADVAWGAWLAAEHGLVPFRGDVAAGLRTALTPEVAPHAWLLQAVLLDAAIRLGVPAAPLDLTALAQGHPDAVAVLATAGPLPPGTGLGLLEGLHTGTGDTQTAWVALGNHLRASRTPGFAAWVLRRVPIEVHLDVFSPDDTSIGAPYAPPSGHVPGCGFLRVPPGWPPIPRYRIDVEMRATADAAAPQHVVSVSRSVAHGKELGFGSSLGRGPERQAVLCGWLSDAAERSPVAHALGARHDWILDWTGRQPWTRYLQPRVDAIHTAYWTLVGDLVARGYVTPDEARTLRPVLRVETRDRRRDTRRALPPVPPARVANPWQTVRPRSPRRAV